MDGINVKSLEEHSEGDVASPSSTGTQVMQPNYSKITGNISFSWNKCLFQSGWVGCLGLNLNAVAMFSCA